MDEFPELKMPLLHIAGVCRTSARRLVTEACHPSEDSQRAGHLRDAARRPALRQGLAVRNGMTADFVPVRM